ncbi:hypothetical protein CMT72_03485 [Elizabethkingia anophelis]|nr:hypothetical protein [Elizabethkingia anophelis]RBA35776.1 hypothetical protein DSC50_03875 [Elizabethkingia anophelis]
MGCKSEALNHKNTFMGHHGGYNKHISFNISSQHYSNNVQWHKKGCAKFFLISFIVGVGGLLLYFIK